jgi:hypothetical protein
MFNGEAAGEGTILQALAEEAELYSISIPWLQMKSKQAMFEWNSNQVEDAVKAFNRIYANNRSVLGTEDQEVKAMITFNSAVMDGMSVAGSASLAAASAKTTAEIARDRANKAITEAEKIATYTDLGRVSVMKLPSGNYGIVVDSNGEISLGVTGVGPLDLNSKIGELTDRIATLEKRLVNSENSSNNYNVNTEN